MSGDQKPLGLQPRGSWAPKVALLGITNRYLPTGMVSWYTTIFSNLSHTSWHRSNTMLLWLMAVTFHSVVLASGFYSAFGLMKSLRQSHWWNTADVHHSHVYSCIKCALTTENSHVLGSFPCLLVIVCYASSVQNVLNTGYSYSCSTDAVNVVTFWIYPHSSSYH